ncbi:uncharacterized protein VP01_1248g4 [Puccinia sorghi]|uniref:Uncharacterized protein n=1 Tax=Puccinia sorghi TaxID=27349 RepID=A0A0L6VQZ8_9BASI|nr:uncharacterized protein VP01_1248g4 [Puccinia sorghi]
MSRAHLAYSQTFPFFLSHFSQTSLTHILFLVGALFSITGATKFALENEIIIKMAKAGSLIGKTKETKLQELQHLYSKASEFLWNTGSGLMDEERIRME